MKKAAQRRMPRFAWDYLVGGLGREASVRRNLAALEEVVLMPSYLADADEPDTGASLFGHRFDAPFAVAPLGLAGLLWPGSELPLAQAARQHNLPYILSTFANTSLETIRPAGGHHTWFQFYPPNDPAMEDDMVDRARRAGYDVLVVTVDIPASARRERDIRNGLTIPPVLTFQRSRRWRCGRHGQWAFCKTGFPTSPISRLTTRRARALPQRPNLSAG
ncbi:alpha-hydroxy-acid oxidizing protein [Rhizobium sp. NLR22b]|nr:alpha-hydroxy-acid oxidizing protein [Rhizobium sp. NLR22b]